MTLELEPAIKTEFERQLATVPIHSGTLGIHALYMQDVLRAHFLIANHFYLIGSGLGGIGPRDFGLLESAIFRQGASLNGIPKWSSLFDVSATLFFGIIKNHAFHDANKRTAFLSLVYQLYRGGWCPSIPQRQLEDFAVEVSDNKLDKYARFKNMSGPDAEVRFISWFLRNNTRKMDSKYYAITYSELQTILHRFGCALINPQGNYITVARKVMKREFGLFGKWIPSYVQLAKIGFPRWTAEVGKGALKTVRDVTQTTAKDGVDSAAFFQGLDPIRSLITTYHDPLMSLASR